MVFEPIFQPWLIYSTGILVLVVIKVAVVIYSIQCS